MSEVAKFSVMETLRSGRKVEIRALRPSDQAAMEAAIDRASAQSLYRRFFGVKRSFSEKEVSFFLNVDFVHHVALVALVQEDHRPVIVAGGRYVVARPGTAELALTVVDQYQGQGIGTRLLRHLIAIARTAGLKEVIAEVLSDNTSMLKVFEKNGFRLDTTQEARVVHVALSLS
ncbi:MAG TPA: GNAT family N-acetyltransferase [Burkholderiaceae bacterium]|nr:GNAT family N-acetyltransferase [Burkholderiaceae bacterium]